MDDQLVSFETAKLAKEKGFNEGCRFICRDEFTGEEPQIDNLEDFTGYQFSFNSSCARNDYMIPTQTLLQRWLREQHKLHINIDLYGIEESWGCDLYAVGQWDDYSTGEGIDFDPIEGLKSYEEALERGLQEALKLI